MVVGARGYGWIPDIPDPRDHRYVPEVGSLESLPKSVDLRPVCPDIYDQKHRNSCTANAVAGALQYAMKKEGISSFMPSRLFIYYNERSNRGVECADCGSTPREGVKMVAKQGFCPESMWPYKVRKFAVKPTPVCYVEARKHRAVSYQRLERNLDHFRACLSSRHPFIFGFTAHDSFEGDAVRDTGRLEMPKRGEHVVGGHAVVAVGYRDSDQRFIARNSFGTDWGLKGYFTVPYEYLLRRDLSADFWTIRFVDGSGTT